MSSLDQYWVHLVPCLSKSSIEVSFWSLAPRINLMVELPLVSFMSPNTNTLRVGSERIVDTCFLRIWASSLRISAWS